MTASENVKSNGARRCNLFDGPIQSMAAMRFTFPSPIIGRRLRLLCSDTLKSVKRNKSVVRVSFVALNYYPFYILSRDSLLCVYMYVRVRVCVCVYASILAHTAKQHDARRFLVSVESVVDDNCGNFSTCFPFTLFVLFRFSTIFTFCSFLFFKSHFVVVTRTFS